MIYCIPFITAFIGWLTNWVAIKMLFHPKQPRRFLFLTWQGLIARRQEALGRETAKIIKNEILNQHTIQQKIKDIDFVPYLDQYAERVIRKGVAPKLQAIPLIGGFINEDTIKMVEQMTRESMIKEIEPIQTDLAHQVESKLDIEAIVADKIAHWDLDKLEAIVWSVSKKEFRTIERLGAIVGFLIGSVQLILILI